MHYTVELLVHDNPHVRDYYRLAVERWNGIWARLGASDLGHLAAELSTEQMWFERNCGPSGNRWVGAEIMVVSGIGMLYSTRIGFEATGERARMLYDAFQRSFCSIAVKAFARELAVLYGLLEERVA
jgi:hypothetical protein